MVDSITPKGDPVTKTYRVRLALPETTPLLIGMTVEVNIVVRVEEDALLLPASAVEGNAVYVVDGPERAPARLEIGIRGTGEVEVLSGIAEDARVDRAVPGGPADGAQVRRRRAEMMRLILDIALTHLTRARPADRGRGPRRGARRRLLDRDGGADAGHAGRLHRPARRHHAACRRSPTRRATPRRQPAEEVFAAVSFAGLRPKDDRRGILNPTAARAALRAWVPADRAEPEDPGRDPLRRPGRRRRDHWHRPEVEAQRVLDRRGLRAGQLRSLEAGGNNIVVGDPLAERLGASSAPL